MRSFARNNKLQYFKRHLDSIISVPPIVKLGKAESLLHRDVPDPAVALQELLYFPDEGFICSKNRGVPYNLLYRSYVQLFIPLFYNEPGLLEALDLKLCK